MKKSVEFSLTYYTKISLHPLFVKRLICSKIFEVNFGRTIRKRWPVGAPVNVSCRNFCTSVSIPPRLLCIPLRPRLSRANELTRRSA